MHAKEGRYTEREREVEGLREKERKQVMKGV